MAITQAQLKMFKKRLGAIELKFGSGNLTNCPDAIANLQLEERSYETRRALLNNQLTTSTAEQQR